MYQPPASLEHSQSERILDRDQSPEHRVYRLLSHISPKTTLTASVFSRALERIYNKVEILDPNAKLIEVPKGDPPDLRVLFPLGAPSGHTCIVGPTGSGKSTIVRHILLGLTQGGRPMQIYTLESPVEVALETHGIIGVNQIDMFMKPAGRERTLESMATEILKHDPDMLYFGELRNKRDFETATQIALSGVAVISTGHASSPLDLLERLRAMNIDLKTQFRAFQNIVGVKRLPILCPHCKRRVVLDSSMLDSRALSLFNVYRMAALDRSERLKVLPFVCFPGSPADIKNCSKCTNGYAGNYTIYEYLKISPEDDIETLRSRHLYTTEEHLMDLILRGDVNPMYLESVL
ncbi:mitochondrial Type II secretion system (T2SS) E-like protein (GspE) [Andalucia godoyi]|uniref:Mitochondrial Type II secretion system (T2SS) E-like protein (GspE) n=1 Tax=Andalucia godoyi TaxID=505711 RepID=A0A8K0F449_ANDGO|nr:mitochondrial Type II secretion system (T2SS) E-like protein (GspE) [Andalucia godoyi]|eukprot:ANDGO_05877.mRNA.2 mitochondrial Type II secretion system (T2SS) E-like protein (GspE)